ncbi:MAG: MTH938/NDUFAF3 family protein [Elusimicrobia bacterium]|jgi:hypothetical protein|nr:MTH938/NDUFAF3 family protein [Elusimicrobiota bacterium]
MEIANYSFGNITIDGKKYGSDILIYEGNIETWWREKGHLIQLTDIENIWKSNPSKLIVGCGVSNGMKVSPEVKKECKKRETELITVKTDEAVKLFNSQSPGIKVAAGFHLTC